MQLFGDFDGIAIATAQADHHQPVPFPMQREEHGVRRRSLIEHLVNDQVHIAHNCIIGRNAAIAGCVGIAGSTEIGANCTIGGLVGIGGHLKIADNVHFNGSTVVTKSISAPGVYSSGTVVQEVHTWRRNAVRFGQLDEWVEKIKALEKIVDQLSTESGDKK